MPSRIYRRAVLNPWIFVFAAAGMALAAQAQPKPVALRVDATDIVRGLLKAQIVFSDLPANATLWYPRWIPGIHAPGGPVENIGELKFSTEDGAPVPWQRDAADVFKFHVQNAAGKTLRADITYLCNQPSVNSSGIDSYGNSSLGVVSWNTCALYLDGAKCDQLQVQPSLQVPKDWKIATPLERDSEKDGLTVFKPLAFTELVDSPVILGENLRAIPLKSEGMPPVYLDLVSESAGALQIPQKVIDNYGHVVTEAGKIFGSAPFDEYHFLVTCSNTVGKNGLEHRRASLNGVGERDFFDDKKLRGWIGYLLPHEFTHAWCGKYRRPAGMTIAEYHTPLDTSLLWVYEGLTQYVGSVLTVRSGMWTFDHYKQDLAMELSWLMLRSGREWRDLEDTARASWTLRGGSAAWGAMRRNQDYYNEGALWWMEADAVIRNATDNKKSLDDFCADFFGDKNGKVPVVGYQRADLIAALKRTAEFDWDGFFSERVNKTHEHMPMEFAARLGYKLQYAPKPSAAQTEDEDIGDNIFEYDSLGLVISKGGEIRSSLIPGMPAEKAGLAPKMKIVAVNNKAFNKDRLRDAIADSVTRRNIEALVVDGDTYRTFKIDYADGPKYLELARDADKPDTLEQIMKAKRPPAK